MSEYGVRECRGHWHVTHAGEDITVPGDPFATEAEARDAMQFRQELDALLYASAQSFLAWEASLPWNELRCPHCGARMNATGGAA